MKSFLVTLFLFAAAFLAYDYFIAPPHQRVVFEKGPPPAAPAPAVKPAAPADAPPAKPAATAPATTAKPAPQPAAAPADSFVPPAIPSIEEATKNWTAIPERAFPRSVVLKQPVEIKMSVGSGQLNAGATAYALAASQGVLTIAPSQGSTARGQIPVNATDFPDQIRSAYEKWKEQRIQLAREDWEESRNPKSSGPLAIQIDPAGKPVANKDGSYNLLLESMRTGQVTEVRPRNIRAWGQPHPGMVDGKPGWLIEVDFTATTMFGEFDTQAQAQIRDGKVVRWIYTGSQEEVP